MLTYQMPCGCVAATKQELLVSFCAEHQAEFNERHAASVADRAAARAQLWEEEALKEAA